MKKTAFLFATAILFCISTISAQKGVPNNYQKKHTLSCLERWSEGQYIDKEQIKNIDWMEYLYWLEKVFGKESPEYKAAIPDRRVLFQQLPEMMAKNYAESPAYRQHPVLGVSIEQAVAYCRWRTDRVAEQMLVKMKFLTHNPNQTRDNYFSLDKYQAPEGMQFQRFSLPTPISETRYGFRCTAAWK